MVLPQRYSRASEFLESLLGSGSQWSSVAETVPRLSQWHRTPGGRMGRTVWEVGMSWSYVWCWCIALYDLDVWDLLGQKREATATLYFGFAFFCSSFRCGKVLQSWIASGGPAPVHVLLGYEQSYPNNQNEARLWSSEFSSILGWYRLALYHGCLQTWTQVDVQWPLAAAIPVHSWHRRSGQYESMGMWMWQSWRLEELLILRCTLMIIHVCYYKRLHPWKGYLKFMWGVKMKCKFTTAKSLSKDSSLLSTKMQVHPSVHHWPPDRYPDISKSCFLGAGQLQIVGSVNPGLCLETWGFQGWPGEWRVEMR